MSRLLQSAPIERDRFVSHVQSVSQADVRSSREVKQANRAVVIATFPGRREHGVPGRVLPMGGLAPGWRVIKVPTLASRASFTRSPISAIVAAAIRALALTSCGFYGRECSVGEKTRPPFRPSERKQDLRLLRPDFGISGVGLHWFDVRNNHEAARRGRWGAASTSRATSGSGRSCCGSADWTL